MIDVSGIREYQDKKLFTSWESFVADSSLDATRAIFASLTETLLSLGDSPPVESLEAAFTECVVRLNELDAESQFIYTIEREDICDELAELGEICGVADEVDEWMGERDW